MIKKSLQPMVKNLGGKKGGRIGEGPVAPEGKVNTIRVCNSCHSHVSVKVPRVGNLLEACKRVERILSGSGWIAFVVTKLFSSSSCPCRTILGGTGNKESFRSINNACGKRGKTIPLPSKCVAHHLANLCNL